MKRQLLVSLLGAILYVTHSFGALSIAGEPHSPSCTGGSDGSIEFEITGGISPYFVCAKNLTSQISTCVDNDDKTGLIQGLPQGLYAISVRDNLGFTATGDQVTILNPNTINITSTLAEGCTNGSSRLSIRVNNITTAPQGFNYSLTGPGVNFTGVSTQTLLRFPNDDFPANLQNGTYQFTVQDNNNQNCATTTIVVNSFNPVTFTYHALPLDCTLNTAEFSIDSLEGGDTENYNLFIDNEGPIAIDVADLPFIPVKRLSVGTHTLRVNSQGCDSETANLVIDPVEILFTPVTTNVSCFNGSDGSISLSKTSANAIDYSIGISDFKPVDEAFNGLTAGTYVITVRNDDSCTAQQTVILHQPTEVVLNAVVTAPNCPAGATGTIVARATGGEGNYAFTLNGDRQIVGSPATFQGLVAGTYTLVATDKGGIGCDSRPLVIVVPDQKEMGVVFTISPANCSGNGRILISNVIGGTSPYGFSVDGRPFTEPLSPVNPENPIAIDDLSAGSHTLRVVDSNNCFSPTIMFEISPTSIAFTSPTIADVSCPNGKDGQITLLPAQVSGNGTQPFFYTIGTSGSLSKPNAVGTSYANLTAGVYPVTVVDSNGCTSPTQEVVVSQPTEIAFSFNVTSPTCPGGLGAIQVNPPTGGSGTDYTYSLDGVTFQPENTFQVPAGTYDLVVKDTNSCSSQGQTVVVQDPQQIGVGFKTTGETCEGCDGTITVTEVLDGKSPFTMMVDGVAVVTQGTLDKLTATDLCGGPHTLQIVDGKGCASPTVTAFVGQPGPLLLTYQVSEVTKNAGNDGKITVENVSGLGKGPFVYSIDGVDFTNTSGEFFNLVAGVYELSIGINGGACILATVEIEVTEPTRTSIIGVKSIPATVGLADGSFEVLTESTAPLKYRISFVGPNGPFQPFQNSPIFTGLTSGNYFIDVEPRVNLPLLGTGLRSPKQIVTAGQGNGAAGIAAVDEVQPITATFTVTPVDCNTGLGGSITVFAAGGTPPYLFSLNGGAFQSSNIFTNVSAGRNLVTIQDANLHSISLFVNVPTVRKPTGSGIFDYLAQNYCPTC